MFDDSQMEPGEGLGRSAATAVGWSALESWGTRFVSFLVFLLLARLLAPEAFGLVAFAAVFIAFMEVFSDQGFSAAIIQVHSLRRDHLDTAFWTNLAAGSILTLIGVGTSKWVATFFDQPDLTEVLKVLSIGLFLSSFSTVQMALFRRQLAFRPLALRSLIAVAGGGVVGITMAATGFGIWSLVFQQLAGKFLTIVVLWSASGWRPGFRFSTERWREMFAYGVNVTGGRLLQFFSSRSDDFLVGTYLGAVALGYYSVGYRILLIVTALLSQTITSVAFPAFSRMQGDPVRLRRSFYLTTELTALVAFPAFAGLAILAPELIDLAFGEKWLPAVKVMRILALAGIYGAVGRFNGAVIAALGRPSWNLAIGAINAAANVIAFAIVVRYGIEAVALSFVVRSYVLAPLSLFAVQRLAGIDVKQYLYQYRVPLAATAAMVLSVVGAKRLLPAGAGNVMTLFVAVPTGVITYTLFMRVFAKNTFRRAVRIVALALPSRFGRTKPTS